MTECDVNFSQIEVDTSRTISSQLTRSSQRPWILLVGKSGSGKSSTINHLFNCRQNLKRKYATSRDDTSTTRQTFEFILTDGSGNFHLSIVDSPGFVGDDNGIEQDASNLNSLQKFLNNHPNFGGTYPNLIYFCISINDNRFKGRKSDFSKMLICLDNKLKIIDRENLNLLIVVTHCESIMANCKTKDDYKKKLSKKRRQIKDVVYEILRIYKEIKVVFIENKTKNLKQRNESDSQSQDNDRSDNYVPQTLNLPSHPFNSNSGGSSHEHQELSDFTRLSNGQLQPLNLFEESEKLLQDNHDMFAMICFTKCFMETSPSIREGYAESATFVDENNSLNCDEKQLKQYLKKLSQYSQTREKSFLDFKLKQFIQLCSPTDEEKGELTKIVKALNKSLLVEEMDLKSMTIENIAYLMKCPLSDKAIQFLETIGIVQKTDSRHIADFICKGFNVFTNKSSTNPVFQNQCTENYYLAELSQWLTIERTDDIKDYFRQFPNKNDLIAARLEELNLETMPNPNQFLYDKLPGFYTTSDSDSQLLEYRQFLLTIDEHHPANVTEEFKHSVSLLPDVFDPSNANCVAKYEDFFKRFGHGTVVRIYGGGKLEIMASEVVQCSGNGQCLKNLKDECDKWKRWRACIMSNPILLTNELQLNSISSVVAQVDETKRCQVEKALQFFGLEFTSTKSEEKESEPDSRKQVAIRWLKRIVQILILIFKTVIF